MPGSGWMRRLARGCLRSLLDGLMVLGGVDMYLEARSRSRTAAWSPAAGHGPVFPSGTVGPPPGHPERMRPDLPLSDIELALLRELARADRMRHGGHW
ncbi:hypothetical protein LO771_29090 [Streptacidiphilus sp. ASG 303]|uniref:DUF6059 family protein n=1 Tax=Streptacidiphilus sp. ASG 303 TaxID=2896847 RepID=UPI001E4D2E82|nr:DUF6059 family protein [Streptacidiphilus sp. ASG 303]MCD0486329.1 hypothetical protein [Streptacidiphilus sp. ASG 303]